MGDKIDYCNYNVFADEAVKEDVRWNALGGYQTEAKYSVKVEPPCGLDPSTVAYLGLEMEYWTRVSAGVNGNMTTVIGDFDFQGGEGYADYYENYGNYQTFDSIMKYRVGVSEKITKDGKDYQVWKVSEQAGFYLADSIAREDAQELIDDIAAGGF